ncbi:MAG: TIGR02391 family protein [Gaiellaceae bacterium]
MLTRLVEEAAALREEPYDSPKVKLWKQRARDFVEGEYGEAYLKILNQTLFFRRAIVNRMQGQHMHREAMDNAITFLQELEKEEPVARSSPEPADTALLRLEDLHPALMEHCADLYVAGRLADAVERSFRVVRDRLRDLTGYETGSEAFGKGRLRVRGAVQPWVEEDFNEAVRFPTMAIDRFRNEKVHTSDARIDEPVRAAEYLAMSSLALHMLDQAYLTGDR